MYLVLNQKIWRLIRSIALITVTIFTLNTVCEAAPLLATSVTPTPPYLNLPLFNINHQHGKVISSTSSNSDAPTVYLIQDAHASLDAQQNIRHILTQLSEEEKLDTVLFEGGSLKLDKSFYDVMDDLDKNKQVWDKLFLEGQMGGVERFSVESSKKINLFGIENEKIYFNNIKAIQDVYEAHQKAIPQINKVDKYFDQHRTKLISGDLKKVLDQKQLFDEKKTDLNVYGKQLVKWAMKQLDLDLSKAKFQDKWPQLVRFRKLQELEQKVKSNPAPLLLNDEYLEKGKGHLRWYIEHALDQGVISQSEIRNSHIRDSIAFHILKDELRAKDLFSELEKLEALLIQSFNSSEEVQNYLNDLNSWTLFKKLITLKLTREEWGDVKVSEQSVIARQTIAPWQSQLRTQNSELRTVLQTALTNYHLVEKRDQILLSNALSRIKQLKSKKTAIITGGFHTQPFIDTLSKSNFNYTVISPHIQNIKNKLNYQSRILALSQTALDIPGALTSSLSKNRFLSALPFISQAPVIPAKAGISQPRSQISSKQRGGSTPLLNRKSGMTNISADNASNPLTSEASSLGVNSIRATKKLLAELVNKPKDFNWGENQAELPDLRGSPLGLTKAEGRINFNVGTYFTYIWQVQGLRKSGWNTTITESGVVDGKYQLTLQLTKDGEETIYRTFQIGPKRKRIAGKRTEQGKGRKAWRIELISSRTSVEVEVATSRSQIKSGMTNVSGSSLGVDLDKVVMIALGGNSLIADEGPRKGDRSPEAQYLNVKDTLYEVIKLQQQGYQILLAHGNGPQVGDLLAEYESRKKEHPDFVIPPLHKIVEETQKMIFNFMIRAWGELSSEMGVDLPQIILNETRVVVDAYDPALANPTKPVGDWYDEKTAERLAEERGWVVKKQKKKDPNDPKTWRRVVPSPKPYSIYNYDLKKIRHSLNQGKVVVTVGGGGVPVVVDQHDRIDREINGVIDKDRSSKVLADALDIKNLLIVTGEPKAVIGYGGENPKEISRPTRKELKTYLDRGEFPPGSMGPKVEASIDFVNGGEKRTAVITTQENISHIFDLEAEVGTQIFSDDINPRAKAASLGVANSLTPVGLIEDIVGGEANLDYLRRIREVVNTGVDPDDETVVLYVASGGDILTALLATDADHFIFVDRMPFSIVKEYNDYDKTANVLARDFLNRSKKGFSLTSNFHTVGEVKPFLDFQLLALGAENVSVVQDKKNPNVWHISFQWQGETKTILFIGKTNKFNFKQYQDYLSSFGQIDFFIQKSGHYSGALRRIRKERDLADEIASRWLKPGGYLILDDHKALPSPPVLSWEVADPELSVIEKRGATFGYFDQDRRGGVFLLKKPNILNAASLGDKARIQQFVDALDEVLSTVSLRRIVDVRYGLVHTVLRIIKLGDTSVPTHVYGEIVDSAGEPFRRKIKKIREEFPNLILEGLESRKVDLMIDSEGEAILFLGKSEAGKGSLAYSLSQLKKETKLFLAAEDGAFWFFLKSFFVGVVYQRVTDSFRARAYNSRSRMSVNNEVAKSEAGIIRAVIHLDRKKSIDYLADRITAQHPFYITTEDKGTYVRLNIEHSISTPQEYRALAKEVYRLVYETGEASSLGYVSRADNQQFVSGAMSSGEREERFDLARQADGFRFVPNVNGMLPLDDPDDDMQRIAAQGQISELARRVDRARAWAFQRRLFSLIHRLDRIRDIVGLFIYVFWSPHPLVQRDWMEFNSAVEGPLRHELLELRGDLKRLPLSPPQEVKDLLEIDEELKGDLLSMTESERLHWVRKQIEKISFHERSAIIDKPFHVYITGHLNVTQGYSDRPLEVPFGVSGPSFGQSSRPPYEPILERHYQLLVRRGVTSGELLEYVLEQEIVLPFLHHPEFKEGKELLKTLKMALEVLRYRPQAPSDLEEQLPESLQQRLVGKPLLQQFAWLYATHGFFQANKFMEKHRFDLGREIVELPYEKTSSLSRWNNMGSVFIRWDPTQSVESVIRVSREVYSLRELTLRKAISEHQERIIKPDPSWLKEHRLLITESELKQVSDIKAQSLGVEEEQKFSKFAIAKEVVIAAVFIGLFVWGSFNYLVPLEQQWSKISPAFIVMAMFPVAGISNYIAGYIGQRIEINVFKQRENLEWGRLLRLTALGPIFFAPFYGFIIYGWILRVLPPVEGVSPQLVSALFNQLILAVFLHNPLNYFLGKIIVEREDYDETISQIRKNLFDFTILGQFVWLPALYFSLSFKSPTVVFVLMSVTGLIWNVIFTLIIRSNQITFINWVKGVLDRIMTGVFGSNSKITALLKSPFTLIQYFYNQSWIDIYITGALVMIYMVIYARIIDLLAPSADAFKLMMAIFFPLMHFLERYLFVKVRYDRKFMDGDTYLGKDSSSASSLGETAEILHRRYMNSIPASVRDSFTVDLVADWIEIAVNGKSFVGESIYVFMQKLLSEGMDVSDFTPLATVLHQLQEEILQLVQQPNEDDQQSVDETPEPRQLDSLLKAQKIMKATADNPVTEVFWRGDKKARVYFDPTALEVLSRGNQKVLLERIKQVVTRNFSQLSEGKDFDRKIGSMQQFRSLEIDVGTPALDIKGVDIFSFQIKGVVFDSGQLSEVFNQTHEHRKIGLEIEDGVPIRLVFSEDGRVGFLPKEWEPEGALFLDKAKQEFMMHRYFLTHGLAVNYPVAYGWFQNEKPEDNQKIGFVILGQRVPDLFRIDQQLEAVLIREYMDPIMELKPDERTPQKIQEFGTKVREIIKNYMYESARHLRLLHGPAVQVNWQGAVHGNMHMGNLSSGVENLVNTHDLTDAYAKEGISSWPEVFSRQVVDFNRVLSAVWQNMIAVNKTMERIHGENQLSADWIPVDTVKVFLEGYFHDVDPEEVTVENLDIYEDRQGMSRIKLGRLMQELGIAGKPLHQHDDPLFKLMKSIIPKTFPRISRIKSPEELLEHFKKEFAQLGDSTEDKANLLGLVINRLQELRELSHGIEEVKDVKVQIHNKAKEATKEPYLYELLLYVKEVDGFEVLKKYLGGFLFKDKDDGSISFASEDKKALFKESKIIGLFSNELNRSSLLRILSVIRMVFYDQDLDMRELPKDNQLRLPLEEAMHKGWVFEIQPNVFVAPITHSFRRFIIYETDKDSGKRIRTIEIKTPGDINSRYFIDERGYTTAEEFSGKFGAREVVVEPLFQVVIPEEKHWIYGKNVEFTTEAPLRIIGFDYEDGMRLSNYLLEPEVRKKTLSDLTQRLGVSEEGVKSRIVKETIKAVRAMHLSGYVGSTDLKGNPDVDALVIAAYKKEVFEEAIGLDIETLLRLGIVEKIKESVDAYWFNDDIKFHFKILGRIDSGKMKTKAIEEVLVALGDYQRRGFITEEQGKKIIELALFMAHMKEEGVFHVPFIETIGNVHMQNYKIVIRNGELKVLSVSDADTYVKPEDPKVFEKVSNLELTHIIESFKLIGFDYNDATYQRFIQEADQELAELEKAAAASLGAEQKIQEKLIKQENKNARQLLSKLVSVTSNDDELEIKKLLSELEGLRVGITDASGTIAFGPFRNYLYHWRVLNSRDSGWEVKVKKAFVVNGYYELHVVLHKNGKQINKIFQVGPLKKQLKGRRDSRGDVKEVLLISERMGVEVMKFLVTQPEAVDWNKIASDLSNLKGLRLGETISQGVIPFSPYKNFSYVWPALGFHGKGWSGVIQEASVKDGYYYLRIRFSKEDHLPKERTFQIGPFYRFLKGGSSEKGYLRRVFGVVSVDQIKELSVRSGFIKKYEDSRGVVEAIDTALLPVGRAEYKELLVRLVEIKSKMNVREEKIASQILLGYSDRNILLETGASLDAINMVRSKLQQGLSVYLPVDNNKAMASSLGRTRGDYVVTVDGKKVNLIDAMFDSTISLKLLSLFQPEPLRDYVEVPLEPPTRTINDSVKMSKRIRGRKLGRVSIQKLMEDGYVGRNGKKVVVADLEQFANSYELSEAADILETNRTLIRERMKKEGFPKIGSKHWFVPRLWVQREVLRQHRLISLRLLVSELNQHGIKISYDSLRNIVGNSEKIFGPGIFNKNNLLEPSVSGTDFHGLTNETRITLLNAAKIVILLKEMNQVFESWVTVKQLSELSGVSEELIRQAIIKKKKIKAAYPKDFAGRRTQYYISPEEVEKALAHIDEVVQHNKKRVKKYTKRKISSWKGYLFAIKDWKSLPELQRDLGLKSAQSMLRLIEQKKIKGAKLRTPFSSREEWYFPPKEVERFKAKENRKFQRIIRFMNRYLDQPISTRAEIEAVMERWDTTITLADKAGVTADEIIRLIGKKRIKAIKIDLIGLANYGYTIPPQSAKAFLASRGIEEVKAASLGRDVKLIERRKVSNVVKASSLGDEIKGYGISKEAVVKIIGVTGSIIGLDLKVYFPHIYQELLDSIKFRKVNRAQKILEGLNQDERLSDLLSYLGTEQTSLVVSPEISPKALILQMMGNTSVIVDYKDERYVEEFNRVLRRVANKQELTEEEMKALDGKAYFVKRPEGVAHEDFLSRLLKNKKVLTDQGLMTLSRIATDSGLNVKELKQRVVWMQDNEIIDSVLEQLIVRFGLPLVTDSFTSIKGARPIGQAPVQKEFYDTLRLAVASWLSLDPNFLLQKGYVSFEHNRFIPTEKFFNSFLNDQVLLAKVQQLFATMA